MSKVLWRSVGLYANARRDGGGVWFRLVGFLAKEKKGLKVVFF